MWTVKAAKARVGGLSRPSKMPGWGFGLSALDCNVGGRLRDVKGSTCSGCYAMKGRYAFSTTQKAQRRRWDILSADLAPGGDVEGWVSAMVFLITREAAKTERALANYDGEDPTGWLASEGIRDNRWFRWHDSGDLQSVRHLWVICEVARQTPGVRHWLPTREYQVVRTFKAMGGEIPPNLTVRLSAHMVDGKAPGMGLPTSTVSSDGIPGEGSCPAPTQGGECKACRACWLSPGNVDYHIH